MSRLTFQDYEMIAADLGPENYMPDIGNVEYIHAGYTLTDRVEKEDAENIGQGMIRTMLPYTLQDNYNRDRKARKYRAAVLENEKLRAVFLPELGGRLWSLYNKELQRELLYVNPIFQPGNLALRNAWFSGGVEWNVGIKGHNPLTCSPLYARRMENGNGDPVLRMYEYERIRNVVYYMDFLLPEGSDVLYVRTTIENTAAEDKYMYWWSNIAVPETKATRVISPCADAIKTYYGEGDYVLDGVDFPYPEKDSPDCSYPGIAPRSNDYFFRIPKEEKKWVAAVEADGCGLLHFSTPELIGRKLFFWGQGQGGRNWNTWLAGEPLPYVEIQAGLARTQYEHIPMKGHSSISWVEGYTAAVCEPGQVQGDFRDAVKAVGAYLDGVKPDDDTMRSLFDGLKTDKLAQLGSAWGHVENCLRKQYGQETLSTALEFPTEAVQKEERIWLDFLKTGVMEPRDLKEPPFSFQADPRWIPMFEKQIAQGNANAYMYLQYGVTLYACEKIREAYDAFEKSNALEPNAWAFRNLSMIEKNAYNNLEKAVDHMEQAALINKTYRGLMVNCAQTMLAAKRYDRWIAIFDGLNGNLKKDSRLQLYKAMALIELKQFREAALIVNEDFVLCDIKEGEVSLSHIWKVLYTGLIAQQTGISDEKELEKLYNEKYPLPAHLDFRMDA